MSIKLLDHAGVPCQGGIPAYRCCFEDENDVLYYDVSLCPEGEFPRIIESMQEEIEEYKAGRNSLYSPLSPENRFHFTYISSRYREYLGG